MSSTEINPEDLKFADNFAPKIGRLWQEKFLAGALEHGGVGKPSFLQRRCLTEEIKKEALDTLSYAECLEQRLNEAQCKILELLYHFDTTEGIDQQHINRTDIRRKFREVLDLLS